MENIFKEKTMKNRLILLVLLLAVASCANALPDLVITDVSYNSVNISSGESVPFIVNINNTGNTSIPSSYVYVTLYIDDIYYTYNYVYGLNSGQNKTLQFSWTAAPGDHIARFKVDDYQGSTYIVESNESNNEYTIKLPHIDGAGPDMVIDALSWTPNNFSSGSTVTLNASIRNAGTANVSGTYFYVYWYVDGQSITSVYSAFSIPVNTSISVTQSWTANTPGQHTLRVMADPYNYLPELNKTNNYMEKPLPYIPAPDYIITDFSWTPVGISNGQDILFNATIKNIGDAAGPLNYLYVGFLVDGSSIITSYQYVALPINASTTITATGSLNYAGYHNLTARADYYNYYYERNESNNDLTKPSGYIHAPDMIVSDIWWTPAKSRDGDKLQLYASIKNAGDANNTRGFYARFMVDGTTLGNYVYISSGPAINQTVNVTATALLSVTNRTYNISVDSEAYNYIAESNESNNILVKPAIVLKGPDIIGQWTSPQYPGLNTNVIVYGNITDDISVSSAYLYYYYGDFISSNYALASNGGTIYNYSSNYGGNWNVSNMINGDTSQNAGGSWVSLGGQNASQWIIIKLDKTRPISKLVFYPYSDETSARWTKDYRIGLSNTGTADGDFSIVASGTAPNGIASPITHLINATPTLYIKLYLDTNWGDPSYIEANELEAWDSAPYVKVQMNYTGSGNAYSAQVPGKASTTKVSYYMEAFDSDALKTNTSLNYFVLDGDVPTFGNPILLPAYPNATSNVSINSNAIDNVRIGNVSMTYKYSDGPWYTVYGSGMSAASNKSNTCIWQYASGYCGSVPGSGVCATSYSCYSPLGVRTSSPFRIDSASSITNITFRFYAVQ